jgi:hypothetical protein
MGKQEALKRFTTDLTAQARSGKMDPIVGRDAEIRQLIDILMRRRQNNPILGARLVSARPRSSKASRRRLPPETSLRR